VIGVTSTAIRTRRRITMSVGSVIVGGHLLLALGASVLPLQSVVAQDSNAVLQGASGAHWFGTDSLGRDVLSRTLHGGQPSIGVALVAVLLAAALGFGLGTLAALVGGWLDDAIMRVVDVLLAMPSLLVLMLVASFIGREPVVLVATLALMYAPPIARVVRGASGNVLTRDFILAARLRGASRRAIVVGEVLPNIAEVFITEIAMQFTWILLAFSSLSFLGLGTSPPTPEWGLMISDARGFITVSPLPLIAPVVMLASLVLGINALVDRRAQASQS
jgi:peptide/nickel transport system permease protein